MKRLLFLLLALTVLPALSANWKNLSDSNWYSGPKISGADLNGKVVMIDCWGVGCAPCCALLPKMEDLWKRYRSKPFMLIGAHWQGREPARVAKLVEANKLTYPIYDRAGIENEPKFRGLPFIYVVDTRGKVAYAGDFIEEAEAVIKKALAQVNAPPSIIGGVTLRKYKELEKKLALGKNIAPVVKKLNADIAKANSKAAALDAAEKAQEAKMILAAIDAAKEDLKLDIDAKRESDPVAAYKLVKDYMVTFPEEGKAYADELNDLAQKAKEFKPAKETKAPVKDVKKKKVTKTK